MTDARRPDPYLRRHMAAIMSAGRRGPLTVRVDDPIEPKLPGHTGPAGDPDGPGRGSLTGRQRDRLLRLRDRWRAGYDSLGGRRDTRTDAPLCEHCGVQLV